MVVKIVLSRLLQLAVVLFFVSVLTFLLLAALPGNAAESRIGPLPNFTPQQREQVVAELSRQLGLDKPLPVQFWIWLSNAATGDFGLTIQGLSVRETVVSRLAATLQLGAVSVLAGVLGSVVVALFAFRTRFKTVRGLIQALVTILLVMPGFWLGLLLIIGLAAETSLFPASGYTPFTESPSLNLSHLVLPGLTLALPQMALYFRYLYAGLQDVADQPFITAARARGITERATVYRHILPNAILPTVTVIGLVVGSLMSGLVIVESVFSWPGLGSLLVQSVSRKDYNVVAAVVLLTAVAYVVVAFLVDVAYQFIDPRTRRHA
ncbi:ABC transporter permease [Dactylosporangium sp. CA-233914]|uniref:ABC transporter permease n=1 Tax=Dactylosporangium sp. CA-233914 TaxID=3239934 RepID=UPI003D8FF03D